MLLKDIQTFLRLIRKGKRGINASKNGKWCTTCMNFINLKTFDWHYGQCFNFKNNPNVRIPDEGSYFKFKHYHMLQKAMLCAYLDTEAILVPNNDEGRIIHEHKLAAYHVVFIDYKGVIVKSFNDSVVKVNKNNNFASCMIEKFLGIYVDLIIKYKDQWNSKPELTKEDEDRFEKTKSCEICKQSRNNQNVFICAIHIAVA